MKRIGLIAGLALLVIPLSTGCDRHGEPEVLQPCADPAPLNGKPDPAAPGMIVGLVPGVDAGEEANRLAEKYGFTVEYVYSMGAFYAPDMTPEVVDPIRCEPTVRYVEYNSSVHSLD